MYAKYHIMRFLKIKTCHNNNTTTITTLVTLLGAT